MQGLLYKAGGCQTLLEVPQVSVGLLIDNLINFQGK